MPVDPREERRARYVRWASTVVGVLLVAFVAYMAYAAVRGSEDLIHPARTTTCTIPSSLGWPYEAINYDQATDAGPAAEPDPSNCSSVGAPAGTDLESEDGTRLAGWYIPAASGTGPAGPTVVLVHGRGSDKNRMLPIAQILHDGYNLVLFDLRNSGQSSGSETTLGVKESWDLAAMVKWLQDTHQPSQIAVLGTSMGGLTASMAVANHLPVQALVLDSTPASVADSARLQIEEQGYPLALPASWAIVLGALFRTGVDVTAADAAVTIDNAGDVPVLIVQGDADTSIDPGSAQELVDAATKRGVSTEMHICPGGQHSQLLEACPDDYRGWVLGFLARTLGP